jgi:predicted DNA-binding protein (UPF0251 family)
MRDAAARHLGISRTTLWRKLRAESAGGELGNQLADDIDNGIDNIAPVN